MSIAQSLLPEFDHEMATTRTLLERVPDGNDDWKPHQKSMPLGFLSSHVATLPVYAIATLQQPELDFASPEAAKYKVPTFDSTEDRLAAFDAGVKSAREAIAATPDSDMTAMWSLKNGDQTFLSLPRVAVLRSFFMNHLIHHRAQLGVYLRMLDVPLPSSYGPSADTAS